MSKKQMICPDCGSTDIGADAFAAWSVKGQDWSEVRAAYDNKTCMTCGWEGDGCGERDATPEEIGEAPRTLWPLETLCGDFKRAWGDKFDANGSIEGGDFVEWMGEWWGHVKHALEAQKSQAKELQDRLYVLNGLARAAIAATRETSDAIERLENFIQE